MKGRTDETLREALMTAFAVAVDARCPVCGSSILAVGRSGRVLTEDLHPIPLHRSRGSEGYMVCDDCGVLAQLSAALTLN